MHFTIKRLLLSFWILDLLVYRERACGFFVASRTGGRHQYSCFTVRSRKNESGSHLSAVVQPSSTSPPIPKDGETLEQEVDKTLQMNFQLDRIANQIETTRNRRKKVDLASKALSIVDAAEDPDSVTYNTLLKVLARTSPLSIDQRPASSHARKILDRMKTLHEQQSAVNRAWYDKALVPNESGSAAVDNGPPLVRVKPNVRTYATVMDALAKMATTEAALETEELLDELEERCVKSDSDFALQPNDFVYNTIITAWAKAGNTEACLDWLRRIENHATLSPGTHTYNTVLTALGKTGQATEAESLLRRMSVVRPNARSYTICMNAWAQIGNPERVQVLLKELTEEYRKSGGKKELKPNTISFSALIHAYARSDRKDKATMAQKVLVDMEAAGVQPNSWTYNKLLNCYALSYPTSSDETTCEKLQMIKTAYQEQLNSGNASTTTFGTVLKACQNLLLYDIDPEFCCSVFQDAIDRGLVSGWVLRYFYTAVPADLFRSIVPVNDYKEWDQLPDEWTRRAKEEG